MMSFVSISTEMPGPWRPNTIIYPSNAGDSFNLNRDARPLATQKSVSCQVEIVCFNLNRDARPLATNLSMWRYSIRLKFQSQPRCQAPGDGHVCHALKAVMRVSIS